MITCKKNRFSKKTIFCTAALVTVFAIPALQAQEEQKPDAFTWVPVEAMADEQAGDPSARRLDVIITETPKATADISEFTKEYVVELKKFNIYNDGTHAVETSAGINTALQHAKTNGANRIVFPKGTYLIDETNPIIINNTDTIIDLNGATLKINPNGLKKYTTVNITYGAKNLRLTNGTLLGDKDTHDYTEGGEWGSGLLFESGANLEVDNMTFTNFMGDGVVTGTAAYGKGGKQRYNYVYTKNLESGGFSEDGERTENPEKTRTIKPYDISVANGQFEFGYTVGYMGFQFVKGRAYQAYFYTDDMDFIEKGEYFQFKKGSVPENAKWIHLEFNQSKVFGVGEKKGTVGNPFCGFISNFRPPTDVHFHHNLLIANRRLGMAFCGGQRWIIEDNRIEGNGGTAPAYGVDFEDGWLLMQDIVFRNNTFKDNVRGDLVVCAGSEMIFEGNTFEKSAYFHPPTLSYTFRNNTIKGGTAGFQTRTGHVTLQDNTYENCSILIKCDPRGINDGFVRTPGVPVRTPAVLLERETLTNVKSVTGTYFNLVDSKLTNVTFKAGKETQLVRFKNCTLEDTTVNYSKDGPEIHVVIENNQGPLIQEGPGLNRRKLLSDDIAR